MENLQPQIRFKGFCGDWEKVKLAEYKDVRDGTHESPNYVKNGYPLITSKNLSNNKINFKDINYISKKDYEDINKRSKVDKGDILLAMIGTIGNPAIVKETDFAIKNVGLIKKGGKIKNNFLINIFNSDIFKKYVEIEMSGNTQKFLSLGKIRNFKFNAPNLKEQEKIGNLFEKLDFLIERQEKYLDLNKKLKKSLLQKLFPKEGEDYPELRFDGLESKWIQDKLGNQCKINTGKLDANAMKSNGIYDFYTSGIKKYKINEYAFEGPSITIAGNGATVGYMHLADGKFNAYQRTYVLTNFITDRHFIFYAISKNLPKKIHEESRAGNIPYIVLDMLTELKIKLPSLKEQEKIGSLFKSLDKKIKNEEEKLSSYKKLKKSLLQKIFV